MKNRIHAVQFNIREKERHLLTAQRALQECLSMDNRFNDTVIEALQAVGAALAILNARQIVAEKHRERLASEVETKDLSQARAGLKEEAE